VSLYFDVVVAACSLRQRSSDVYEDEKEMFFLFFIFVCFGEVAVKAVMATTLQASTNTPTFSNFLSSSNW
jgi:hypothetical protein